MNKPIQFLREAKNMATKAKTKAKAQPKKKVAPAKKAPAKKKKAAVPSTEFTLYAPGAEEVFLAGDFNEWQADSKDYRMRKFKGDVFKKKVKLKSGRYEYQFVVDGNWWPDPENQERCPNPYCGENSVKSV